MEAFAVNFFKLSSSSLECKLWGLVCNNHFGTNSFSFEIAVDAAVQQRHWLRKSTWTWNRLAWVLASETVRVFGLAHARLCCFNNIRDLHDREPFSNCLLARQAVCMPWSHNTVECEYLPIVLWLPKPQGMVPAKPSEFELCLLHTQALTCDQLCSRGSMIQSTWRLPKWPITSKREFGFHTKLKFGMEIQLGFDYKKYCQRWAHHSSISIHKEVNMPTLF